MDGGSLLLSSQLFCKFETILKYQMYFLKSHAEVLGFGDWESQ